jgi:alpha-maltose-1-phosphate synthase
LTARVVVGDAGFLPTTRQMASALAPWLDTYYTPLHAGAFRGLARLPPFAQIANRRTLPPEVRGSAMTLAPTTDVVRLACLRLGVTTYQYKLIWRRNLRFDEALAERISSDALLIGQYGACLEALRASKRLGGRVVLDHPTAEPSFGRDILREEIGRRPAFADTIEGSRARVIGDAELARIRAEAAEADLVLVGSEFAARTFRERLPVAQVAVVSYGADTTRFRPALQPRGSGPLRVLFAGQLGQLKGLSYLLEAFDHLDPARFQLTLAGTLIGSGDWIDREGHQVRHLGALPHAAMPAVYREADVLVLPSLVEGSAVVVLEALASGVPVIVTPNVGADAVTDGTEGFVVPIRDPEAIAARLEELAQNPELRFKMATAARARAERGLDWTDFRNRLIEILQTAELLPAADPPEAASADPATDR